MKPIESAIKFLVIIGIIALIIIVLSSCKLTRTVAKKSNSSDTTSVSKAHIISDSGDSSKIKSEKTSTKETTYYPQPIIIKDENQKPQIVFVPQTIKETSTDKTEQLLYQFQKYVNDKFDSLQVKQQSSSKDAKTEVKTDWVQIAILSILGLLVFDRMSRLTIFSKIKKVLT